MSHERASRGSNPERRPRSSPAARRDAEHRHAPASRLALQDAVGNHGLLRLIQAKRAVSQPGDPHELEADRIADRAVTGPPIQRKCACEGSGPCPKCSAEREGMLSRKAEPSGSTTRAHDVAGVRLGPGRPLEPATRRYMESRLDHDFGGVRVHTDEAAASSARALEARAFTTGRDIAFAPGEYQPDLLEGRRLLAHELAHVVQQSRGEANGISRQPQPSAEAPAPVCYYVGIELPFRIYLTGDRGTVTASILTTLPAGDYTTSYNPQEDRFDASATGYRPSEPPLMAIYSPSDPALFEQYRESVRRHGVPLHVAGGRRGAEQSTRGGTVPAMSITADYARTLDDQALEIQADVYRTRLMHALPAYELMDAEFGLRVLQSEQLRRQAGFGQLRIEGEVERPPGLPPDGAVLQPADALPDDLLAALPEGRVTTFPVPSTSPTTATPAGPSPTPTTATEPELLRQIVTIEPLDANLQPLAPTSPGSAPPLSTFGGPLAGAGTATNLSMNAQLVEQGFTAAAGPDTIGLVGIPRWFTRGARFPESMSKWGHTAVFVRQGGRITTVRGFDPEWGLDLLRHSGAVEQGKYGVQAVIADDASLFTKAGALSLEYPVAPSTAADLVARLPNVGPIQPGSGLPFQYTARPSVVRVCTQSNCGLWAAGEAERALGGPIGPASRGVSVTSLGEEGAIVEATASQGRIMAFMRSVERGTESAAPVEQALGPAVASGMRPGLQVLKWGGRAFFVLGLATIPLEIFLAPPGQKVRTAVGATAGFLGGLATGAAAGVVCGPGALFCSIVLGLVFGVAGALGARALAESIYDALVTLKEHPEALLAPPMATTLSVGGGYSRLLSNPAKALQEMRQRR